MPTNQTPYQAIQPTDPQSLNLINDLSIEWQILHSDYEKYEQYALLIKLFSVGLCLLCIALSIDSYLSLMLILTLWFQEGIWKTYQARSGERLLTIEAALKNPPKDAIGTPTIPFSFYSTWETQKPGTVGLIIEYISNALRPTVMYPYVILIAIYLLHSLF
ncbi:hypothetical protein A9Q81_12360 [Gammaproteobacteria bacterium 42_54_T18]|nr:hypothetical protein A9Q81_12360 [Gammaproteobacteria bacterium 42_54_T18]